MISLAIPWTPFFNRPFSALSNTFHLFYKQSFFLILFKLISQAVTMISSSNKAFSLLIFLFENFLTSHWSSCLYYQPTLPQLCSSQNPRSSPFLCLRTLILLNVCASCEMLTISLENIFHLFWLLRQC